MECRMLYFTSWHKKEIRQYHSVGCAPASKGNMKDRVGSEISFLLVTFLSGLQGGLYSVKLYEQ